MGEHCAFGRSSRPGRINDGGEVIGDNNAGRSLDCKIALCGTVLHQALHVEGMGSFNCVHDYHFFDGGLILDGENFCQLLVARNENDASAGITQDVGSLLVSERGIDRNRDGAEKKRSEVGD